MGNDRGQYGMGPWQGHPVLGADPAGPSKNLLPWIIGGIGVAVAGLVVLGGHAAASEGPQLSAHDKEVRAWQEEFPGLPWYEDEVKTSDQKDSWERARSYWEKKHG